MLIVCIVPLHHSLSQESHLFSPMLFFPFFFESGGWTNHGLNRYRFVTRIFNVPGSPNYSCRLRCFADCTGRLFVALARNSRRFLHPTPTLILVELAYLILTRIDRIAECRFCFVFSFDLALPFLRRCESRHECSFIHNLYCSRFFLAVNFIRTRNPRKLRNVSSD